MYVYVCLVSYVNFPLLLLSNIIKCINFLDNIFQSNI